MSTRDTRGVTHEQEPAASETPGPDIASGQEHQVDRATNGPSMPTAVESPVTSDSTGADSNRVTYRDIDRLKGQNSAETVDTLLNFLDHPNNWVKAHALKPLLEIGSPRALPRLVARSESKGNELAIRGAYMAIGGIGPNLTSPEDRRMAIDGLKKSLDLYRDGTISESRGNMYVLIEAAGKI